VTSNEHPDSRPLTYLEVQRKQKLDEEAQKKRTKEPAEFLLAPAAPFALIEVLILVFLLSGFDYSPVTPVRPLRGLQFRAFESQRSKGEDSV
jgi:hypothetical protein